MLKSLLLAGFLLVLGNVSSANFVGVPIVQAAPAARTAVKHSAQLLGPGTAGEVIKVVSPSTITVSQPSLGVTLAPAEEEFIARVNSERTARGLNALLPDPLLTVVAREHSREMCSLDYFDHHSPTSGLVTPMDRYLTGLHAQGLSTPAYLLVGENIYYCSVTNDYYNVEYGHQALMHSPGHRANILEPRFARVGVGVYQDARGQFWVTEMFLKDQE